MGRLAIIMALVATACAGEVDMPGTGGGDEAGGDGEGGEGVSALSILSPDPGATYKRKVVGELGYLVALVPLELQVPDGTQVVRYKINGGTERGGAKGPDFALDAEIRESGPATIKVIAYDADGAELDHAAIDVEATSPTPNDCHGWLDLYGQKYRVGPASQGVSDPVTLTMPINGVRYRYITNSAPRETFFMDCQLAKALLFDAPILRERGVVEVADIGLYNYRCINNVGTPPNCPYGMSQHSYGKALDRGGFKTRDGTFYSVLNDWVIDPDSQSTCEAPTSNKKDAWLHDLICAEKRRDVWHIALTPNYNDIHRNHFHVDLTPGEEFIELATAPQVDVVPDGMGDD